MLYLIVGDFYERNYQLTFVVRDVEAFFKYRFGDVYSEFYGGIYKYLNELLDMIDVDLSKCAKPDYK